MHTLPASRVAALALISLFAVPVFAASTSSSSPTVAWPARQALSFEPNRGQAESRFDFVAYSHDSTIGLSRGEASLTLPRWSEPLQIRWAGADPSARAQGNDPRPARSHYFRGPKP